MDKVTRNKLLQRNRERAIADIERGIGQIENRHGLCLYLANHTVETLLRHGYQAVIQAGSLQWPRIRPEGDDGKINTHFAYMWTPQEPASDLSVAMGNLPEMHVWAGIVDSQEIVDFSTKHLKEAASACGMTWTAKDPPRYLWCSTKSLPHWVVYRPDRDATIYACRLIKRLFNPPYLQLKVPNRF